MEKVIGKTVDIVGWSPKRDLLASEDGIQELIVAICSVIGMKMLKSISVHVEEDLAKKNEEIFEDEGGASAVLILSTSHIAFHGWPNRDTERYDGGFFWLNISSCRSFVESEIESVLCHFLEAFSYRTTVSMVVEP